MPQMSPLQWDLLNLMSTLLIILVCVIMFYKVNFKNSEINQEYSNSANKIMWKW